MTLFDLMGLEDGRRTLIGRGGPAGNPRNSLRSDECLGDATDAVVGGFAGRHRSLQLRSASAVEAGS